MREELLERYKELGYEAKEVELKQCIRVNTLKITAENLAIRLKAKRFSIQKVPFLENAFFVENPKMALSSTQEHLQGYFYIQEAAAQLSSAVLEPEGIVLDCCAAPGGKATQMAVNADIVVAIESQYNRIQALINNIERLGVKNCLAYNVDARAFEPKVKFDKILVDAPCSGSYTSETQWLDRQSVNNFNRNSEVQKDILANASKLLKDDGELLYSTCSLEPEEDEFVVDWAVKILGLKVVKINCIGDQGLTEIFGRKLDNQMKNCRRLWPSKTNTQGFFIAKMKK